jgi:hypothetical protein
VPEFASELGDTATAIQATEGLGDVLLEAGGVARFGLLLLET